MVILIFGLSGSGKTTIGMELLFEIENSLILDGDIIRRGLNKDLGLSIEDRAENIRRIAEMAKVLNEQGKNVIISAICPTNEIRNNVKEIIGKDNLITIYLSTSLDVCKERDVKGLYAKYGDEMTGIKSVFEEPESYDLKLDTSIKSVNDCVNEICEMVEISKYPKSAMKKYNFFHDDPVWILNYKYKYAFLTVSKCASAQLKIWCDDDNEAYNYYIRSKSPRRNRTINMVYSLNEIPEGFKKFVVYRDPIERFYSACHFPGYDAALAVKELKDYVDENGICLDNYIKRQSDLYNVDDVDYIVNLPDLNDFLKTVFGDDANRKQKVLCPKYNDVDLTLSDEDLEYLKTYYSKDKELEKSDKFWKK